MFSLSHPILLRSIGTSGLRLNAMVLIKLQQGFGFKLKGIISANNLDNRFKLSFYFNN